MKENYTIFRLKSIWSDWSKEDIRSLLKENKIKDCRIEGHRKLPSYNEVEILDCKIKAKLISNINNIVVWFIKNRNESQWICYPNIFARCLGGSCKRVAENSE